MLLAHAGASEALLGKAAGTRRKRPFAERGPSRLTRSKSLLTRCCQPPAAATGARLLPGGPAAAEPPRSPRRLRQPRGLSRPRPAGSRAAATPPMRLLPEGRAAREGAARGWGHSAHGDPQQAGRRAHTQLPDPDTQGCAQRCPEPGVLWELPGRRSRRGPCRAQTQLQAGSASCAPGGAGL